MTYSAMVIEAVATLASVSDKDAKNGSSLVAIRKQILATYGSNLNKQAASFNSLTLKGINKVGEAIILTVGRCSLKYLIYQ